MWMKYKKYPLFGYRESAECSNILYNAIKMKLKVFLIKVYLVMFSSKRTWKSHKNLAVHRCAASLDLSKGLHYLYCHVVSMAIQDLIQHCRSKSRVHCQKVSVKCCLSRVWNKKILSCLLMQNFLNTIRIYVEYVGLKNWRNLYIKLSKIISMKGE